MNGDLLVNLYFLVVLAIGYNSLKKIKGSSDFFIADKKSNVFEVSGSLLATVLGSSAILGSVTFAYSSGWAGAWLMLCGALGFIALIPLIKHFKDFKGYNLPEMMGSFYGNEVKILSSIIIPIAWIGIVAAQIMGAAQIISIFSSFSYQGAVIISGMVFIVYTILGGQLSIIKTDCIQLLFILGGILLCYFSSSTGVVNYEVPKLLNQKFSHWDLVIMVLTYSSTFFVGPDIYSRLFCAKDEKVAKKAVIISILILIPLAFILARIGIQARHEFPGIVDSKFSPLLHMATNSLSSPVAMLLYFGLLSAVISSADTSLLTAASIFCQIFTGDLKTEKSVRMTRIFIAIFGGFSILVAIKMKYILSSLLLALTVYSGALIIPCFAGILGYRGEKTTTLLAIIAGGGVALYGKLYGGASANIILIGAFAVNSLILFFPYLKRRFVK